MFKVVKKRDFVRSRANFQDCFVVTRDGVPEGIWLSVAQMRAMDFNEIQDFLFEVFKYLGIFDKDG